MFEQKRGKSFYYKLDLGHREGIFSHCNALTGLGAGAELGPSFSSEEGLGTQGWALARPHLSTLVAPGGPCWQRSPINLNKPGVEGGHAQIPTQTWQSQVGALGPGNSDPRIYTTKGHAPTWLSAVSLNFGLQTPGGDTTTRPGFTLPTPMPPAFATHSALCSLQVCPELADSRIRGSGPPRRPHPSASGFPEGRGGGGRREFRESPRQKAGLGRRCGLCTALSLCSSRTWLAEEGVGTAGDVP